MGISGHAGHGRLAGLLASSSVAALLLGSGGPAAAACYTGPFAGGYASSGAASCITVNNTSFTGNLSNSGTIGPASTGIAVINNSTITGQIIDSGVISATSHGILIDSTSKIVTSASSAISFRGSSFGGGISNAGTISASRFAIALAPTATAFSGGIDNSGMVSASLGGIFVNGLSSFGGGISNSGTISASALYGILVEQTSTFTGGISNSGTISAGHTAVAAALVSTFIGGISNSGTISSGQSGIAATQIVHFGSSTGGGITNSGTISAASSGVLVYTVSTFSGGIGNSGTIVGGINAIAVKTLAAFTGGISNSGSLSNSNIAFSVVTVSEMTTFSGGITNSGTISGGNAIDVAFVSTFSGGITNSGTISAAGHTGIFVSHISSFSGNISNAGSITAATGIKIRAGNGFVGSAAIVNTGTIIATGAAVNASIATSAVTIDQNAGSIAGSILLPTAAGVVGTLNIFGGTFNGNVTGGGTTGSDVVNFAPVNGSFAYAGTISGVNAVNINSGTLFDGGAITAAGVVVNSGATLAPGAPGTPGALNITGDLAFNSGASYEIQLTPTQHASAAVSGNLTIDNGTVVLAPPQTLGAHYAATTFSILTYSGTLTGAFNPTVAYLGALQFSTTPTVAYAANNVDLTFGSATYVDLATPAGANPNQQKVVAGIDNAIVSGAAIPAGFANLANLSSPAYANALSQLSGETSGSAQKSSAQLMTDFLELMLDPTAGGGGGVNGGGANGFAPEQDTSLPADVALAYAKALKGSQAETQPQSFDQRWTAWGSAFGGASHIDGNAAAGTNNVTASDYGFAAGMERHLTPDTVYGFGLAGGGTNWNLAQNLGSGRSDSFQAGLYGKTHWGPLYLSGGLAFANHWFTTDRTAAFGDQLRATFTGQSYAARGEVGYRYAVPITGVIVGVTPYAALQAQDFHTPSYSETDLTGGGFALSYASQNATDTRSELGARFDNLQVINGMPLVLRGRLAWAHDWVTGSSLGAAFQALPGSSFTVNGAAPPPNSALTTAAAELHLTSSWTAIAKFDGEFGAGAQTYGGTGTLKYSW